MFSQTNTIEIFSFSVIKNRTPSAQLFASKELGYVPIFCQKKNIKNLNVFVSARPYRGN
jgi:hypothetical protein